MNVFAKNHLQTQLENKKLQADVFSSFVSNKFTQRGFPKLKLHYDPAMQGPPSHVSKTTVKKIANLFDLFARVTFALLVPALFFFILILIS